MLHCALASQSWLIVILLWAVAKVCRATARVAVVAHPETATLFSVISFTAPRLVVWMKGEGE